MNWFTLTFTETHETREFSHNDLFNLLHEASKAFDNARVEKITIAQTRNPNHVIRQWVRHSNGELERVI